MVTQIKYWLTIPMPSILNHNKSLKTNPYKIIQLLQVTMHKINNKAGAGINTDRNLKE